MIEYCREMRTLFHQHGPPPDPIKKSRFYPNCNTSIFLLACFLRNLLVKYATRLD